MVVALLGCPASSDDDTTAGPPADDDDQTSDDDQTADDDVGDDDSAAIAEQWDRDVLATDLEIDLQALTAVATLELAPSEDESASFEAAGLTITSVEGAAGPLDYCVEGGRVDVALPPGEDSIRFEYGFGLQSDFDGYDVGGFTFLWPYYCGNLFPCHSDPADGTRFTLELTGIFEDAVSVAPAEILTDAPSYQIAWAVGAYAWHGLGTTVNGTEVGVWYLPGQLPTAIEGTEYLLAAFDWLEQSLGDYPFGARAGTVELEWGPGGYGGMEHHPYWHVGSYSMADRSIHVHEAAHGWYGDGIRIRCWEDFVLSEGTVTYLTARAIEESAGEVAGLEVWEVYESQLQYILDYADGIAWPDSCGEVDILEDGLFSLVPYIKGAYFYAAVADAVGEEELDAVLAEFFVQHVGEAAGMQDMLDLIEAETGFDATTLSEDWLRNLGAPIK